MTSYYSIGLDKYTSFQTHIDEVRHITSLDGGILTVSGNAVRLTSRQGLQQFTLKSVYYLSQAMSIDSKAQYLVIERVRQWN